MYTYDSLLCEPDNPKLVEIIEDMMVIGLNNTDEEGIEEFLWVNIIREGEYAAHFS